MAATELGGVDRRLTSAEAQFLSELLTDTPPLLDVWRQVDNDGSPWLIISYDVVVDGAVRRTLRLDFDGSTAKGGWSPALLNWDYGLRAESAPVDFSGPDGFAIDVEDVSEAASKVRSWFERHYGSA